MYYLMQFFRMSMTKKNATVCLSAFLFGPCVPFYRKMWKEGLLAALVMLLLSAPELIAIVATFNPTLFGSLPLGGSPRRPTSAPWRRGRSKIVLAVCGIVVPQRCQAQH